MSSGSLSSNPSPKVPARYRRKSVPLRPSEPTAQVQLGSSLHYRMPFTSSGWTSSGQRFTSADTQSSPVSLNAPLWNPPDEHRVPGGRPSIVIPDSSEPLSVQVSPLEDNSRDQADDLRGRSTVDRTSVSSFEGGPASWSQFVRQRQRSKPARLSNRTSSHEKSPSSIQERTQRQRRSRDERVRRPSEVLNEGLWLSGALVLDYAALRTRDGTNGSADTASSAPLPSRYRNHPGRTRSPQRGLSSELETPLPNEPICTPINLTVGERSRFKAMRDLYVNATIQGLSA